jgi:hypothetical protein
MITISKQINLSSNSAKISNYPKNSSCFFEMPNMMKRHEHVKYIMLGISHAEIPVSFYIINDTNNKLVLNINSSGDTEYILTNGNYNGNTFKTMLLSILGIGWDITLSSSTGKYTLSHTTFDFIIRGSLSTCYKLFGFSNSIDYYSSLKVLILPNPCNFLGTLRINVKSTVIKLDNLDSASNGHSGTISSIFVNAELYGIIIYQNQSNFKNLIYNDFLNGIDIIMTDSENNLLDFNGCDWFLTLQFDEYMDVNEISNETNLKKLMNQQ